MDGGIRGGVLSCVLLEAGHKEVQLIRKLKIFY